jgi:hypothetical protein
MMKNYIMPPMDRETKEIVPIDSKNRPRFYIPMKFYRDKETGEVKFNTKMVIPSKSGTRTTLTRHQLLGGINADEPNEKETIYGPTLYTSTNIATNRVHVKKGSVNITWKISDGLIKKITKRGNKLEDEQREEMENMYYDDSLEEFAFDLLTTSVKNMDVKPTITKEKVLTEAKDVDNFLGGVEIDEDANDSDASPADEDENKLSDSEN